MYGIENKNIVLFIMDPQNRVKHTIELMASIFGLSNTDKAQILDRLEYSPHLPHSGKDISELLILLQHPENAEIDRIVHLISQSGPLGDTVSMNYYENLSGIRRPHYLATDIMKRFGITAERLEKLSLGLPGDIENIKMLFGGYL